MVERVLPFVTIYSGRPEINVFNAPPPVVAALPGMTAQRLNTILDKRAGVPADQDSMSRLLGSDQAGATSEGSDAVRVSTRIAFDNGRLTSSEVVILVGDSDEPYHVLYWQDDVEPTQTPARGAVGTR
jgi:general secretion pathway protein K